MCLCSPKLLYIINTAGASTLVPHKGHLHNIPTTYSSGSYVKMSKNHVYSWVRSVFLRYMWCCGVSLPTIAANAIFNDTIKSQSRWKHHALVCVLAQLGCFRHKRMDERFHLESKQKAKYQTGRRTWDQKWNLPGVVFKGPNDVKWEVNFMSCEQMFLHVQEGNT